MAVSRATRYRNRQQVEAVVLTDLARIPTIHTVLFDSLAVGDVAIPLRERQRVLTDSLEVVDRILPTIITVLIDSVDVSDAFVTLRERHRLLADTFLVSDDPVALRIRQRVLFDSLEVGDSVDATKIAGINERVLSDSISVLDSATKLRLRSRLPQDAVTVLDSDAELRTRVRQLLDSADVADDKVITVIRSIYNVTLTDAISLTDAAAAERVVVLGQFDIEAGLELLAVDYDIVNNLDVVTDVLEETS